MIAAERETTVVTSDADDKVTVWTAQRRYITKLRRDKAWTEVESGEIDGSEYAIFTIPSDRWTPSGVVRKRNMTEVQRAAARERLTSGQKPAQDKGEISQEQDV